MLFLICLSTVVVIFLILLYIKSSFHLKNYHLKERG
jgi:hypothetical protein